MNRRDFIRRMRFVAAGGVEGYLCRNLGSPTPEQHLIQAEIAGDWNASPEFDWSYSESLPLRPFTAGELAMIALAAACRDAHDRKLNQLMLGPAS